MLQTSSDTLGTSKPRTRPARQIDHGSLNVAVAFHALGFVAIWALVDFRMATLFLVGGGLGFALYQGSFGFTGSWRRFVVERRGRGIRAQMLMIGIAGVAIMPLLQAGSVGDQALAGAFAPVGVSVVIGSLIFGIGMQLGGGCGSGTLFTVGGGSARMLITLLFFIVGATIGTAHLSWWLSLPAIAPVSLHLSLGLPIALAFSLLALFIIGLGTWFLENRRHGESESLLHGKRGDQNWLVRGPWPIAVSGLTLALLSVATLLIAGHTWSITYGFGLWGAKAAQLLGAPVETWDFWAAPAHQAALNSSVLSNSTSVMNFGLILGAALAASLAGKFALKTPIPLRSALAAIIGGLLMGYGARLSFGCNIGALFSGIASGSLHGWVWFAVAFVGSYIGVKLRPAFGLEGFKKS